MAIMADSQLVIIMLVIFFSTVAFLMLKIRSHNKLDPREPPVIPSTIPYAGHVWGMLGHGASYFKFLW